MSRPLHAFVVPAFEAEDRVAEVVGELRRTQRDAEIIVVDDGSTDATAQRAQAASARVVRHPVNRGKGAALMTGFEAALRRGARMAVTVDADGQHLAHEALRLAEYPAPLDSLVLGVRDLARDLAPANSQVSNAISNLFLSAFTGHRLEDTQCGLRRYPLPSALDLGTRDRGYAFEAEVLLRASRAGIPIVQVPVEVYYPPPGLRQTHFHVIKDPSRIVRRVVKTLLYTRLSPPKLRGGAE
ncbi:MAG: glycosyltransferase family 2 protein [Polyangiaceae bacterium]